MTPATSSYHQPSTESEISAITGHPGVYLQLIETNAGSYESAYTSPVDATVSRANTFGLVAVAKIKFSPGRYVPGMLKMMFVVPFFTKPWISTSPVIKRLYRGPRNAGEPPYAVQPLSSD